MTPTLALPVIVLLAPFVIRAQESTLPQRRLPASRRPRQRGAESPAGLVRLIRMAWAFPESVTGGLIDVRR